MFKLMCPIDIKVIIDCLMARTAFLVCSISTVNGLSKKGKCLGRCGASSGQQQNLSNLYSLYLYIYGVPLPLKMYANF
jgi:hypothetical protein